MAATKQRAKITEEKQHGKIGLYKASPGEPCLGLLGDDNGSDGRAQYVEQLRAAAGRQGRRLSRVVLVNQPDADVRAGILRRF